MNRLTCAGCGNTFHGEELTCDICAILLADSAIQTVLIENVLYTDKSNIAQYYDVNQRTVNNWLTSGKLSGVNALGKWLIRVRDVTRFKLKR